MKKKIVVTFILVLTLAGVTGFSISKASRQFMMPQINAKGLPEHGLIIFNPTHHAFDRALSAYLGGKSNSLVEKLKPFSIFVKNTDNRAVVALKLKWELMKSDGSVITKMQSEILDWRLMGGAAAEDQPPSAADAVIKPRGIQAFSLGDLSLAARLAKETGPLSDSTNATTSGQAELEARVRDHEELLNTLIADWANSTNITVSIDGAFFEDGTFVGPDTTQFFDRIKSDVDAKYDLLNKLRLATEGRLALDEVFGEIEKLSQVPGPDRLIASNRTPSDYYNAAMKSHAKELLRLRGSLGSDKAAELAVKPLRKQRLVLRKG